MPILLSEEREKASISRFHFLASLGSKWEGRTVNGSGWSGLDWDGMGSSFFFTTYMTNTTLQRDPDCISSQGVSYPLAMVRLIWVRETA